MSKGYLRNPSSMILDTTHNARPLRRATNGAGAPRSGPPPRGARGPTTPAPARCRRRTRTIRGCYLLILLPSYLHTLELPYLQTTATGPRALCESKDLPYELPVPNNVALDLRLALQTVEIAGRTSWDFWFCFQIFFVRFHVVVAVMSRSVVGWLAA